MSEIGLAPWYAGRLMGLVGRGTRVLNGIAVHDSRLWQSTSRPVEEWMAEGMVRVFLKEQQGTNVAVVNGRIDD